ncbi:hypothetical protein Bbelb_392160 [Branchiostoma belcheri]|nr:hypothetical protein Bbelb_392160 [Branchiostoma belcheri]
MERACSTYRIQHGVFRIARGTSPTARRIARRPEGDPIRGRAGTEEPPGRTASYHTGRNTRIEHNRGPDTDSSTQQEGYVTGEVLPMIQKMDRLTEKAMIPDSTTIPCKHSRQASPLHKSTHDSLG